MSTEEQTVETRIVAAESRVEMKAERNRLVFELTHFEKIPLVVLSVEGNAPASGNAVAKHIGIRPDDLGRLLFHWLTVLDRVSSAKTGAGEAAKGDTSGTD